MGNYSKSDKIKMYLITGILVLAGSAMCIFGNKFARSMNQDMFVMDGSGMIIVSALCGYVPGLMCVFISFVYKVFQDSNSTYVIFLYMIAALLASWFATHRWFKSRWKTVFASLILMVVTGAINSVIIHVTMGNTLDNSLWDEAWTGFKREGAECIVSMFVIYMIMNFLPEKLRKFFPNVLLYSKNTELIKGIEERLKERSRLSFRITMMTAIEAAILALSAAFFANNLIGSMNFPGSTNGAAPMQMTQMTQVTQSENAAPPGGGNMQPSSNGIQISGNGIFNNNDQPWNLNKTFNNGNLDLQSSIAFDARLIMLLFTFSVLIATAANFYAQRRIAHPIKKMSKAMSSFAYGTQEKRIEGVDNIHKLNIDTHDEIEELYQAIDTTVDDFQIYVDRIRQEERLENDLKVAQASSEAKSNFLSSMSHEIRTPINAVLGFDEMIIRDCDDPEIVGYAEDIQNAGKTLLGLVNDILDFSKIEAGKLSILPVEYELSSTINDLVNMVSVMARDKGLYLDVNVDRTTPHLLYGDEIRIKQIILNILTNAVKYTEKGGITFNVGYEKADEEHIIMKVSIKDTGIGIRQEDMDKLFSPFERLDEMRNRAVKGTGLGMSITKQLLTMMDSKLDVASEYGKGSEFSFRLSQKVTKWEEIGNLSDAFKKYIPRTDKIRDDFHAPKAKILVVDDTKVNLTVVKGLLRDTHIQVDTADGGHETLEKICQQKYNMVFIDHMMPGMDGVETFHKMKDLEGNMNAGIPWIVLTANAISGAREMYMKEGFMDYLSKPVDYLKMKNMLMKYLPKELIEIGEEEPVTEEKISKKTSAGGFDNIEGIDPDAALANCGSADVLKDVISEFYTAIPSKADLIEKYWKEKDFHDYTIQVHALKSSARLVGAMKLSKDAKYLEDCGSREASDEIDAATPALLGLYRSYITRLKDAVNDGSTEDAAAQKPVIDDAKLKECLAGIREFADAFDFDDADQAMKFLDGYRMPDAFAEKYKKLKELSAGVDRDGILELLADI